MVNNCTVCLNNSRKNRNISYFIYPKNTTRRNEWLKAVGREDLLSKLIDDKTRLQYRICEDHFEISCIKFSSKRKYLLDGSFPTLNLPSNEGAGSSFRLFTMTKGKPNGKVRNGGKVLNFDHLVFWVANAKTAASYFVTRFGFEPFAIREATEARQAIAHVVKLNKIIIVFESPTSSSGIISQDLADHGDFVKDVAFEVHDLDELMKRAKSGGAEIVQDVTEDKDEFGVVKYAVLRTYGDNTHTLLDRSKYNGVFLPGFKPLHGDPLNNLLPNTNLMYIDHVEGNMADGTLEDSVSWYEKNLSMHRFWCVDYKHDLTPYSCIKSASVINRDETVLLSMNEAAKGIRPTSKATEFVKALGTSGVEHVALYTNDIIATMRNLKARGADILSFPPTYYDVIAEKLQNSSLKVTECLNDMKEYSILIDFDERGYMLQAFTKHIQTRPTVFIEVIQRKNHRGFGAMNYKWVFEAIERLDVKTEKIEDINDPTTTTIKVEQ